MLTDLSAAVLSAATEESFRAHLPLLIGRMPGAEVRRTDHVEWSALPLPYPGPNVVSRFNVAPDVVDEVIDDLVSALSSRRVPFVVWVGSSTKPADLGKRLKDRGLTKFNRPGMAADLQALPSVESPSGLEIRRVTDERGIQDWVDAAIRAEAIAAETRSAFVASFTSTALGDDPRFILFVGRIDGAPVATSWLFPDRAVAGLYGVSTVPEARLRGIGTAMSCAALREGIQMGYRVGVLFSSDMAVEVYRGLGFAPACTLEGYRWIPE